MKHFKLKKHIKSFPKLPSKFFTRFALYCANDVKHLMDNEALRVLEVTQLWLKGKAAIQEVRDAAYVAYNASANSAEYAATYASYTAYDTAFAAADAADNAAFYAAASAADAANKDERKIQQYYNKFNEMLNELSGVEKVIYEVQ
jgi:hypothetical protein